MPCLIRCLAVAGLLVSHSAAGQTDRAADSGLSRQTFFDLMPGLQLGVDPGASIALGTTVYFRPHWGAAVSAHGTLLAARNLPSDYKANALKLFSSSDPVPKDFLATVGFRVLRRRALATGKRLAWVAVGAGPAYGLYFETEFTPDPNHGWFTPNYASETRYRHLLGLEGSAEVVFRVGRSSGIGIGLWGQVNGKANVVCAELVFHLGHSAR